ncbi:hypothetical protein GCM10025879_07500 [Leuconostoc litchii]|nr:DUF2207 domain-containing protein [Leuconostoc litchii]GMA69504.1 hypothetical protein GCM10025879_07500 [Leuconostoc litchii]
MKLKITVFAFLFAILSGTGTTVLADKNYSITNLNEVVQIDANGTAHITKTITYHFDENMNGIYFKESLDKGIGMNPLQWGGLTAIEAKYNNGEKKMVLPRQGESSGYVETKTNQEVEEKIYYPVQKDSQLTMSYRYTLKNMVINWHDVAEINWIPISARDVPIGNVGLQLVLPNKPATILKAWVHSHVADQVNVNKNKATVTISSKNVDANNSLEIHSYFDPSQTPLNTNKQSGNRAEYIQNQEQSIWRKKRESLRVKKIIGLIILPIVFSIVAIIASLQTIKRYNLLRNAQQQSGTIGNIVHIFDIPNDLGPALISQRIGKTTSDSKLIIATLLDLIARRKISMSYNDIQRQDDISYRVTDESNLQSYEIDFINMIFGKKRRAIIHSAFKQPESVVSNRIKNNIASFKEKLKQAEKNKAIIDHALTDSIKSKQITATASLIVITLLSTFILASFAYSTQILVMWYLVIIQGIIGIIIVSFNLKPAKFYTVPDGFQEKWQWDGFAKMLHDIGHLENKTILDVQLWDKILAYAIIFGEAKNVARQMKIWAKSVVTEDSMIFLPIMLFGDNWVENLVHNVQYDGAFHVESDSNGDGGSFFDGSSGGAGGGSDGAF